MFIVEFINHPLSTGWSNIETIASVESETALVEFFERELDIVDGFVRDEVEDILEAAQWPECTAHYRISFATPTWISGKRTRVFTDN
jgi:hypothetical protein